jgi:hypothetical protein
VTGWQVATACLTLLFGCFLAWQFWLVWTLHTENLDLQSQVTHLSDQVCLYQKAAETINQQLALSGHPRITVPAPADCPP